MTQKKVLFCPVGEHVELGYLTTGEVCAFICKECQFLFKWDKNGKLLPPIKLGERIPETCDCPACQLRNERLAATRGQR